MRLKPFVILFLLLLLTTTTEAQQIINGTLTTKLGVEMAGKITVNLTGENPELIQITTVEKVRNNRKKQTLTTNNKLNVAFISKINTNGKTYYFRDIKVGYNDTMMKNVCVELIAGNLDCGIFQSSNGNKPHSIAIKFPKAIFSELASVDFEYYSNSLSVPMRFSECKSLMDKMINNDETVTWNETANREQRIQRFKNIIEAYNICKSNN